jgi:hypothetical protein
MSQLTLALKPSADAGSVFGVSSQGYLASGCDPSDLDSCPCKPSGLPHSVCGTEIGHHVGTGGGIFLIAPV